MLNPVSQEVRNSSGRKALAVLAIVFIAPFIAAVLLYNFAGLRPVGMINHGDLISPPRPLEEFSLVRPGGGTLVLDDLRGKWTFVYIGGSDCDAACRRNIYHMRQVRWAQGEEMLRVQRLFVLTDSKNPDTVSELKQAYPGMLLASGDPAAISAFIRQFEIPGKEAATDADRIYIVDPLGNLMMSYAPDADPKGMMQDMMKLLKISQIG